MRVGSGIGPCTTAPVLLAVSTISDADWSRTEWSYASIRIRIRSWLPPATQSPPDKRLYAHSAHLPAMRETRNGSDAPVLCQETQLQIPTKFSGREPGSQAWKRAKTTARELRLANLPFAMRWNHVADPILAPMPALRTFPATVDSLHASYRQSCFSDACGPWNW